MIYVELIGAIRTFIWSMDLRAPHLFHSRCGSLFEIRCSLPVVAESSLRTDSDVRFNTSQLHLNKTTLEWTKRGCDLLKRKISSMWTVWGSADSLVSSFNSGACRLSYTRTPSVFFRGALALIFLLKKSINSCCVSCPVLQPVSTLILYKPTTS